MRHQQELDAATAQVRQIDRGAVEQVVQSDRSACHGSASSEKTTEGL